MSNFVFPDDKKIVTSLVELRGFVDKVQNLTFLRETKSLQTK